MKKLTIIAIVWILSINLNSQKLHKQLLSKGPTTFAYLSGSLSTYEIAKLSSDNKLCFGDMKPVYSIQFARDSLTYYIDFSGDSIKVGGNMPVSKSAELFFSWLRTITKTKIDSLEDENKALRKMLYIQAIKIQKEFE